MKPTVKGQTASLQIAARGPGRPRSHEPSTTVSAWVPASTHDRLIQVANQQEKSVSQVVRDVLVVLNVQQLIVITKR